MIFLKKAWVWLKANWKWVLFPIGILVAIITLLPRLCPGPSVLSPGSTAASEAAQKAKEEADRKAREAEEAKKKRIEELKKEHDATIQKLTDEQKAKVDELVDDPDGLNKYLLDVGKQIRG